MANIFKLLNRSKKTSEEDIVPSPEIQALENRTIVLDLPSSSSSAEPTNKKEERKKTMTDAERALKVPNQNADLNAAAPLPDISKMADAIGSSPIQMKTFDIVVYEIGDDGNPTQKPVSGVKAQNAQELMMLYGAEGTKIKILREYGDGSSSGASPHQQPPPGYQPQQPARTAYAAVPTQQSKPKEPPKFFEIGGVKCKLEDGKMYQEQWMKVDSSKYRLIADSTNKLVSMNGKHLEMLKWVQIEDGEDEQNNG